MNKWMKASIVISLPALVLGSFAIFKVAGKQPKYLVSKLRNLEIGMTTSQVDSVLTCEVIARLDVDYKKSVWTLKAPNMAISELPYLVFDSTSHLIFGRFDGYFEVGKYPELLFYNWDKDDSSNLEKWLGEIKPL